MGKLKLVLSLLLTIALLAAGACLPRIVAALQDGGSIGQASFADVPSVELQIRQDIPAIGKLAMIDRLSGTIDISPDMANLTDAQALDAVRQALDPYISAGLIPELSPWNLEPRVLLAQVSDMPQISGIFWSVIITGNEKEFYSVDLTVDDETGRLLRINFAAENWDTGLPQEDILGLFAEIYFTGLDIPDYQDFATNEMDQYDIGENTTGTLYRFVNPDYGEVEVELYVYQHGFYTAFHELVGKEPWKK